MTISNTDYVLSIFFKLETLHIGFGGPPRIEQDLLYDRLEIFPALLKPLRDVLLREGPRRFFVFAAPRQNQNRDNDKKKQKDAPNPFPHMYPLLSLFERRRHAALCSQFPGEIQKPGGRSKLAPSLNARVLRHA
ncbi:MAG: hypothetical protein FWD39_01205 [Clostridiales bacterium]|nr:hypothetical protein [Clostridiales bacterium]